MNPPPYPAEYGKYLPETPPTSYSTQSMSFGIPLSSTTQSYSEDSEVPVAPKIQPPKPRVPWSTGLCDCFSDPRNCLITCCCPCITFGKIAELVDKGSNSCGASGALYTLIVCVTGCPCCYSCFYRSKMRQQFMLKETPCGDCCVHCFCEYCALCQEYRELKFRGFDMGIGWHGNVEKQNRGLAMITVAPSVEDGMSR